MKESYLRDRLRHACLKLGGFWQKNSPTPIIRDNKTILVKSSFDAIAVINGIPIGVEIKQGRSAAECLYKLTETEIIALQKFHKAGGLAIIVGYSKKDDRIYLWKMCNEILSLTSLPRAKGCYKRIWEILINEATT